MTNFKKAALKTGVIGLALYAGYAWVNQSPEHAEKVSAKIEQVTQVTTEKTEAAFVRVEGAVDTKTAQASEAWENLALAEKTSNFQDEVKPYGASLKRNLDPNRIPGASAVRWLDKKTSIVALFFVLVGCLSIVFVGTASPSPVNHR